MKVTVDLVYPQPKPNRKIEVEILADVEPGAAGDSIVAPNEG
jgi:hypothetical protein